jgi:outer membrane protein
MKNIIIALLLLVCSKANFAQTEKGAFVLSGKTDLHFLFSQNTAGTDSIQVSKIKTNEYGFSLGAGYFIADNLSVGVSSAYTYSDSRSYPNQWMEGVESITTTFSVIPQLSYYLPVEGKLKPSLAAGIGYTWLKERNSQNPSNNNVVYKASGPSYNAGVGASYFITRSVAFDLSVQYSHSRLKEPGSEWLQKQNAVAGAVGISVYL